MRRTTALRCVLLASVALGMACSRRTAPPAVDTFEQWLDAGHRQEALAYSDFLRGRGVDDVVPPAALLRTSRRWRACGHAEFSVPPPADWPKIVPTLRVVRRLVREGVLDPALARSGFRDETMNDCAGGSARSRHLDNRGIDFDLPSADRVDALCSFWRAQGQPLQMGLGFYTPTRIHVDATGYRTWGRDHRHGTSLCVGVR